MLDHEALELARVAARVDAQRRALRQAVDEWVTARREAVVSVQGLAAVAASAFTLGIALRGRRTQAPAPTGRVPALLAVVLAAVRIHRAYHDTFLRPGAVRRRGRQRPAGAPSAG
ncbi:MAG: hypothetical protein JZU45_05765 [Methyloversatilis discipulorum]|jgi:hypothetical protein|uniref:hypothetical protein n=1 Tax=Methyloversatilis discipulorum TaxID=1119528 RepID=UPI0026ED604F|nr:hypothetical protein [Methyloversatilis discipulorum]MBV5285569.1 hypothetical protein [Methyloversatilis discipulorum]